MYSVNCRINRVPRSWLLEEGFCQICIAQSKTDLSAVISQYGCSPSPKKEDISIPTTSGQACVIDLTTDDVEALANFMVLGY